MEITLGILLILLAILNKGHHSAQGSFHHGVWGGLNIHSLTPIFGEVVSMFRTCDLQGIA